MLTKYKSVYAKLKCIDTEILNAYNHSTYIDSSKVAHIFSSFSYIEQFRCVGWDSYVVHQHQGAVHGHLQEVGLVLLSQVTQDILENKQAL